jgi:hypothetical protein
LRGGQQVGHAWEALAIEHAGAHPRKDRSAQQESLAYFGVLAFSWGMMRASRLPVQPRAQSDKGDDIITHNVQ